MSKQFSVQRTPQFLEDLKFEAPGLIPLTTEGEGSEPVDAFMDPGPDNRTAPDAPPGGRGDTDMDIEIDIEIEDIPADPKEEN